MLGRFLTIEYAILATIIAFASYVVMAILAKLITFKIGEANKHSYANSIYKHMNLVVFTYLTLLEVLVMVAIWAGYLPCLILVILACLLIALKYRYGKKVGSYLGILNVVKNNKCDLDDYVEIDGTIGKITKFDNYHLELLEQDGTYAYISGSNVDNIINYSRNVLDVKMEIGISNQKDINEVIKLLEKELPAITQDYPVILEGPNIDGVSHINPDSYTLVLSTKLKYENIEPMRKVINAKVASIIGK